MNLRPLQILTRAILAHSEHYSWSLQGFGMLRLYIADVGRLHIWNSALRYPNVSMTHTHSWDLRSTIIAGRIVNTRFVEEPLADNLDTDPEQSHNRSGRYMRQRLITGYQTRMVSDVVPVYLQAQPREIFEPGDVYAQHAREIHRTDAEDGTITLMERHEDVDGQADVFWPASGTWGTAKPRPATDEEIRDTVALALRGLL